MGWLAVDKKGVELILKIKPERISGWGCWADEFRGMGGDASGFGIELPKGSILKLIGRELTWEDEPIELK